MCKVIAIVGVTEATGQFVDIHGTKFELFLGQGIRAAKGELSHSVVHDLIATRHDSHQESIADVEVLPR